MNPMSSELLTAAFHFLAFLVFPTLLGVLLGCAFALVTNWWRHWGGRGEPDEWSENVASRECYVKLQRLEERRVPLALGGRLRLAVWTGTTVVKYEGYPEKALEKALDEHEAHVPRAVQEIADGYETPHPHGWVPVDSTNWLHSHEL